jgi:hypothetical protein
MSRKYVSPFILLHIDIKLFHSSLFTASSIFLLCPANKLDFLILLKVKLS